VITTYPGSPRSLPSGRPQRLWIHNPERSAAAPGRPLPKLPPELLRGAREPRLDDHLVEVGDLDLPESDEDGGMTVQVRGREADPRLRREARLLDDEIGDTDAEDVSLRRFRSESLEIGLAEGALPDEPLAVHEPGEVAVAALFGRSGKREREAVYVLP